MSGQSKNHTLKGGTSPYSLRYVWEYPPGFAPYHFLQIFTIFNLKNFLIVPGVSRVFHFPYLTQLQTQSSTILNSRLLLPLIFSCHWSLREAYFYVKKLVQKQSK